MGRPINKKFFANTNAPYDDAQTGGNTGVGGEGILSVLVGNTGSNYSAGATISFGAPNIPGGIQALGSATIAAGAGGITAVSVSTVGSGYTSTATVSVTTATGVSVAGTGTAAESTIYVTTSGLFTGMTIGGTGVAAGAKVSAIGAGTVTASAANTATVSGTLTFRDLGTGATFNTSLTSSAQNGIIVYAYIPGGSSGVIGDIMKQEASRRYLVKTAQGQGQCLLVTTSTLSSGQMYMTASDVLGNTYFVDKLTSRKARLYQYTLTTGTFEFSDASLARWSLAAATTGTVQVENA